MMINLSAQANGTQLNACVINAYIIFDYWLYLAVVLTVPIVIGNGLILLTFYKTKTLRSSTDYFIVNMAASDMLLSVFEILHSALFYHYDSPTLSQTLGTILCKTVLFFSELSFGVSTLSLSVITGYRFYAVAFATRARVQRAKTRVVLLVCTWLIPMALRTPDLYYLTYVQKYGFCSRDMNLEQYYIYRYSYVCPLIVFPAILMTILYPVILLKLARHKIPGNSSNQALQARRRKQQNIRLTKLFIAVTVTFWLSTGPFQVISSILFYSQLSDWCIVLKLYFISYPFYLFYFAINPALYFIFCSSYRRGVKQVFSQCCCQFSARPHQPEGEQVELENVVNG